MSLKAEELSRNIPVTILYKWLVEQAGGGITDSVAALNFIPDESDGILKEKAVASVAIHNNRTSLWDGHGFLNTCLIFNSIPASADYLSSVDPSYINYTVWELVKDQPGLMIGPHAHKTIIACLDSFGYVYPPEELQCVETYFLSKYKEAEKIRDMYNRCKGLADEEAIRLLDEITRESNDKVFYRYHVTKMLSADKYLRDMIYVYEEWEKLLGDDK